MDNKTEKQSVMPGKEDTKKDNIKWQDIAQKKMIL
jgi:hypothetical protein